MSAIDDLLRFLFETAIFGVPLWVVILILVILYYLWMTSRRRRWL